MIDIQFELFQDRNFLEILKQVYFLEEVTIPLDIPGENNLSFFRSKILGKKKEIFNLPFQFYHSSNDLNDYGDSFFEQLQNYSDRTNNNIIFKSLSKIKHPKRIEINTLNSILPLYLFENYEEYYKTLSKSFKQNIRTAYNKLEKAEIDIETTQDPNEIIGFYHILAKMYVKRHRMVFQPIHLYRKILAGGFGKLVLAKNRSSGQVLAGILLLLDDKTLHYSWGATDLDYYKFSLNTILVNEAIKEGFGNGFNFIDFGSTPKSDEKLLFFKDRWKAQHLPIYYYFTKQEPSLLDLNNSYQIGRKIFSLVPYRFSRHLMPYIVPLFVN